MFRLTGKRAIPVAAIVVAAAVGIVAAMLSNRERWCLSAETYAGGDLRTASLVARRR